MISDVLILDQIPLLPNNITINVDKNIYINMNESINLKFSEDYDVILSLMTWNEMLLYNNYNYGFKVQNKDKIFLQFPLNIYIEDHFYYLDSLFPDLVAITTIINNYRREDKKILLYGNRDIIRQVMFVGFCMLSDGIKISIVFDILIRLDINQRQIKLLEKYNNFLKKLMNN